MFRRNRGIALVIAIAALYANSAQAWYGPFCYSNKARQISLTIPTMAGETPGDIKVSFDDNDDKVRLVAARASNKVKNAHEVVLARDDDSRSGILGVLVTGGRSSFGYKFELEFRDDPADCMGAIIKVSDKFSGDIGGTAPEKDPAPSKPAPKPKKALPPAVPVEEPAEADEPPSVTPSELVGPTRPVDVPAPAAAEPTPAPAPAATEAEPAPRANDSAEKQSSGETSANPASPNKQDSSVVDSPAREDSKPASGDAGASAPVEEPASE